MQIASDVHSLLRHGSVSYDDLCSNSVGNVIDQSGESSLHRYTCYVSQSQYTCILRFASERDLEWIYT